MGQNFGVNDLPPELRHVDKPQLDWKWILQTLAAHYATEKNLAYGWVLYDYLDKMEHIKVSPEVKREFFAKAENNANKAKSLLMDELIGTGVVTLENLSEWLKR